MAGPQSSKGSLPASLGLLLTAIFLPWGLRSLTLLESSLTIAGCDLWGYMRDALASFALVFLVLLARRVFRLLGTLVVVLWWVAVWAEYEHVAALGAPIRLENLGYVLDPVFFVGSILSPGRPVLFLVSLLLAAVLGFSFLKERPEKGRLILWAGVSVMAVVLGVLLPRPGSCPEWRYGNALFPAFSMEGAGGPVQTSVGTWGPDLSGVPRFPFPNSQPLPDVLLVLLEGVSGSFLPSVAQSHGVVGSPALENLDEIARQGHLYSTFFYQQRQTHRGEYALLCGDLPRLWSGPARFADHDLAWPQPCLPELLGRAGFKTVYLQAAPLGFMSKDQALPRVGFQEIFGDEVFSEAYQRTRWGVDDHTFFRLAVEKISDLRRGSRPFFLTLLTVGTHHPFTVPDEMAVEVPDGSSPDDVAFLHLDHAFKEFWQELRSRGWLDDTIVLVTADEGWGVRSGSLLVTELSQALGFLVAHVPGAEGAVGVEEPFAQSDVALSILDLLGLAGSESEVAGRSLFRSYSTQRPLFFANTYQHRISGYFPRGRFISCREDLENCQGWDVGPQVRVQPSPVSLEPEAEEIGLLADARTSSLRAGEEEQGQDLQKGRSLKLVGQGAVTIPNHGTRIVFGGQGLELPAGSVAEVELDLEVAGEGGWVHIRHDMVVDDEAVYRSRFPVLEPSSRLVLRYQFFQQSPHAASLEARMQVDRVTSGNAVLQPLIAKLEIRPAEPEDRAGLTLLEESVERAASPPVLVLDSSALAAPDHAPCLALAGSRLAGRCGPGLLLSGPALYSPAGSELSARVEMRSQVRGRARLLMGSERAGLTLIQGPTTELSPGQFQELRVEGDVNAALPVVQLGLLWEPEDGAVSNLVLGNLRMEVKLP